MYGADGRLLERMENYLGVTMIIQKGRVKIKRGREAKEERSYESASLLSIFWGEGQSAIFRCKFSDWHMLYKFIYV